MAKQISILSKYQEFQKETSKQDFDIKYLALGLGGEVGEVQNEIKKLERDDNNVLSKQRRDDLIDELGDVMWYMTGICDKLNCSLTDVINNNMIKLEKKRQNSTETAWEGVVPGFSTMCESGR